MDKNNTGVNKIKTPWFLSRHSVEAPPPPKDAKPKIPPAEN